MKTNKRYERGQALVLIVLAIVAIFGFAALAVDFGRLYAERRRVQNAVDSAALAAAFAAGQSQDWEAAAFTQLRLNDVFDTDPNPNADLRVDVEMYSPPISGPYSGRVDYYQVIVHSAVDQVFSQFVYRGPLALTVEAVGRMKTASGATDGRAIYATSDTSCNALRFHGTGDTFIQGGGAFSDSGSGSGSCSPYGAPQQGNCASAIMDGSGSVDIEGGTIGTAGSWDKSGASGVVTTDSPINQCAVRDDLPDLPVPSCDNLDPQSPPDFSSNIAVAQPGIYSDTIQVSGKNSVLTFEPGIYCLDKGMNITGGTITGDGVLFVVRGGDISITGTPTVNLKAVGGESLLDADGMEWSGMLIYMPYDNTGIIQLGGGSTSQYTGTIYAPGPTKTEGQDKCVIIGRGDSLGMSSSIMCYTVEIGGTADVTIYYNDSQQWHMPPNIELAQ